MMFQKEEEEEEGNTLSATVLDIDAPYTLTAEDVRSYHHNGFARFKNVLAPRVLDHYGATIDSEVQVADKTPLEDDKAYQQAFTQVPNLWERNATIRQFVMGKRLGRMAAELLQVDGVRVYHDQALCKEPGGGVTPWHCDHYYWPLATDKVLTAWIPLQPVPPEMGPLEFAVGSHTEDLGRSLGIGVDSEREIRRRVVEGGYSVCKDAFELGEVSFHAGWTFHRANGNHTRMPRRIMTIIFMDKDMVVTRPDNRNQWADLDRWLPGVKPGEIAASPLNPILGSLGASDLGNLRF
ncbi:hypothetical protein WJX72_001892 [[Myrmecia] bisecta]|uniref:Phytanoyl-CoA dioxygenase n=1 Tax=[Myrmecia] bisecta TaxID=41462 RepID=A0AAW1PKC6_9CHLO